MSITSPTSTDLPSAPEPTRRDFLFVATAAVGGVGACATLWPFIDQMNPDAATRGGGPADQHRREPNPAGAADCRAVERPAGVHRPSHQGRARRLAAIPRCSPGSPIPIPPRVSSRPTRSTGIARSNPSSWFWSGSAPISAASPVTCPSPIPAIPRRTGSAAISVPATARNTTSRAASFSTFPRPTTSPCRRIIFPTTRHCASAKIPQVRISTSIRYCRSEDRRARRGARLLPAPSGRHTQNMIDIHIISVVAGAAPAYRDFQQGGTTMAAPLGSFVWYEYMASDAKAAADFYARGGRLERQGRRHGRLPLHAALRRPERGRGTDDAARGGAQDGRAAGLARLCRRARRRRLCGEDRRRRRQDLPPRRRHSRRRPLRRRRRSPRRGLSSSSRASPPKTRARRWRPYAPGNVGWRELRAGDLESAFAFYSGLFGWKKTQAMDMGPMGTYQVFEIEGGQGGGMMTKTAETPAPVLALLFQCRRHRRRRRARQVRRRPDRRRPASRCPAAVGSSKPSIRKARRSRSWRPNAERASRGEVRKGLLGGVRFVLCCAAASRRGR